MSSIIRIVNEAQQEIDAEQMTKAKARIKDKLRTINTAKAVLANLEREYADLVQQIQDGN